MTWEVNSVNVNSVDAQLYNSPFSDYSSHQARNGSKLRMAHANTLFTPTRTAEELIPCSVPMPSKEETMRFQLNGSKMTNMIPGAQVNLPKTSLTAKDIPGVPVTAGTAGVPAAPNVEAPTPVPAATLSVSSESYHTPKWRGVRARTGYMTDRKYQRDGKRDERYHTPKWRGAKARTGYMSDRKKERFGSGASAAIVIIVILVVLALIGFLLWKFVWLPKHTKTSISSITAVSPSVSVNNEDYIAPTVGGELLFGGKKAKKSKSGKVKKCSCGKCPYCLKKKAKKSKDKK